MLQPPPSRFEMKQVLGVVEFKLDDHYANGFQPGWFEMVSPGKLQDRGTQVDTHGHASRRMRIYARIRTRA